jgi:hypothetical protein
MNAQARQDARRENKDSVIELMALVHQIAQTVDPHAPTLNAHWRKRTYRALRDIFKDLGRDEISYDALLRLNRLLDDTAEELKQALVKLGTPPRVHAPAAIPTRPTRALADEMIKLIGSTGLARTQALDRALKARGIRAANARDLLRQGANLPPASRWVEPYQRDGETVAYRSGRPGRAIGLWMLTAFGRARYRELVAAEPVESELIGAIYQPGHSLNHALGILELADALEALGCVVERHPTPLAVDAQANPTDLSHVPHIVPDLVIRAAPPDFIPAAGALRDLVVEYETNGNAAGSHAEQWAKRARRLGVCAIVLPNAKQQENMRYELARAQQHPAFAGLALTAYLSNLPALLKGERMWETLVLRN